MHLKRFTLSHSTAICMDEASSSTATQLSDVELIKCHPLMPVLELLCEKCGDATHTMHPRAFQMNDVCQLFRKLESNGVSATTGNEKIDKLMKDAIVVLRIHLIELQKVASLAEDFHTKYLQALRKRVSHDVLVESTGDSDDDLAEPNRHDEIVSSRLQGGAVATLTTPQGTVSISFDPRTVLSGVQGASTVKARPRFDFTSIERNRSLQNSRRLGDVQTSASETPVRVRCRHRSESNEE
ncbi:unnamed protein product [Cylicocyclus nassatus]|uniref:MEIS N-terminal domain-containing protein n=1 Tax=Cylicocyclus nassatus TaxID=53992 RepID=A0AA36HDI3_CYLNA|nr:unnamed protein product [Cylicocyclus nassatus]